MTAATEARGILPPGLRRRVVRTAVPLLFAVLLGAAYAITLLQHTDVDQRAQTPTSSRTAPSRPAGAAFDHHYPPDPAIPERPKVTGPSPRAPRADVIRQPHQLRSLTQVKRILPRGVLTRNGSVWTLHRAVELRGVDLAVHGPAILRLRPGAFVLASRKALLHLSHVTVVATGPGGKAAIQPTARRAFMSAG